MADNDTHLEDIERVLEKLVIKKAKQDYEYIQKGNAPDHVGMTEAFAYALQHNIFSDSEIKRLNLTMEKLLQNIASAMETRIY